MKTSNYAKIFLMSENTLAILGGVGDCDLLRFYFVSNDFFFFTVKYFFAVVPLTFCLLP